MFAFLTKNRKGFTIVELMVVLVLLSFGVLALINMFKVTFRAFEKAEERAIKQEAVKTVAELLRSGSNNVAAAMTADIFRDNAVVPNGDVVDDGYSYLYAEPHSQCSVCGEDWVVDENGVGKCSASTPCADGTEKKDGYFLYILNKGVKRENARLLSDVPIYATMTVFEDESYAGGPIENQCGVTITLAALEEDYEYDNGAPISDDVYYSLDVAYHFPNMVTSDTGGTVNYIAKNQLSSANKYDEDGNITGSEYAAECCVVDEEGKITYYPCGYHPLATEDADNPTQFVECGCDPNAAMPIEDEIAGVAPHTNCADCDCACPNKQGIVLRVYVDSILSGDDSNTSVDVPSLCFIATASYGQDSGEVGLLCDFRDKCLLTNPLGTAFVKAYYKLSPPVADFIRESEPLKAAVRVALKPLVAIATNALDDDAASQNAPWFVLFMLCGAGTTATLIKVDKRRKADKAQSAKN